MSNPYAPPGSGEAPPDAPPPQQGSTPPPAAPKGDRPPSPRDLMRGSGPQLLRPLPRDRRPPDPEQAKAASRRLMFFGLFTLATLLTSQLAFPWSVGTAPMALLAAGTGIWALQGARSIGATGSTTMLLTVGIALSLMLGFMSLSTLVFWKAEAQHQQCIDGALTVQARDACTQAYQDAITKSVSPTSR